MKTIRKLIQIVTLGLFLPVLAYAGFSGGGGGGGSYTLPAATTSALGGIISDGATVLVNASGVISVSNSFGPTITSSATADITYSQGLVTANSASAVVVTIPNDSTVSWVGNSVISVYQAGAGTASFSAGSGVTLHSPSGIAAGVQYGTIAAMRVSANTWTLM